MAVMFQQRTSVPILQHPLKKHLYSEPQSERESHRDSARLRTKRFRGFSEPSARTTYLINAFSGVGYSLRITSRLPVSQELRLARHFFDRRLPQSLPNIDANLLNGIVPIAEPIPLWRVGLCSACHIRRPGGNHCGATVLNASDELPSLPTVSLSFAQ